MVGEGERVQRRERGFLDLFFSPRDSFPLLSAHSAAVKREERGERGEREIQREKRHTHAERARERGVKNKSILFKFILIVFSSSSSLSLSLMQPFLLPPPQQLLVSLVLELLLLSFHPARPSQGSQQQQQQLRRQRRRPSFGPRPPATSARLRAPPRSERSTPVRASRAAGQRGAPAPR